MSQIDTTDLEHIRGNAWSFSTLEPPQGCIYVGKDEKIINGKKEIFYYYFDPTPEAENRYLFETESGYQFKREMEEAKKKRELNRKIKW